MSNKLVKPQPNDFVIDDGTKPYYIKNLRGKLLGTFEFRPSDTNIISRYEEVVDYFNNFSVPKTEDREEAMNKAEKEIIDKISYLINADAGEAFFSIMGAFSLLPSGELFCEYVLGRIAKTIEMEMNVRMKKFNQRMNKYVAKYHK